MPSSFTPSRRSLFAAAGLGVGAALLAACGSGAGGGGSADGNHLTVVTSAYPLRYLATKVGGEHVEIVDLTTPGADAHGLELSIQQVIQVEKADLVPQIPGFQTALDDAIASHGGDNVLDVSSVIDLIAADAAGAHGEETSEEHAAHADEEGAGEGEDAEGEDAEGGHDGHDHGAFDPHFWHDPVRMADLGDAIAQRLGELSPELADEFTANAEALRTELETLDQDLTDDFGAVDGDRPFITSHAAYVYLAQRYDLHQIGITGVDPETEPSPQRLLALEGIVRDEGVTTVFFETTASPKVAQTLADNLGITAEELDNLETQLSEDADYPQVMRENCTKLVASWA